MKNLGVQLRTKAFPVVCTEVAMKSIAKIKCHLWCDGRVNHFKHLEALRLAYDVSEHGTDWPIFVFYPASAYSSYVYHRRNIQAFRVLVTSKVPKRVTVCSWLPSKTYDTWQST